MLDKTNNVHMLYPVPCRECEKDVLTKKGVAEFGKCEEHQYPEYERTGREREHVGVRKCPVCRGPVEDVAQALPGEACTVNPCGHTLLIRSLPAALEACLRPSAEIPAQAKKLQRIAFCHIPDCYCEGLAHP